MAQWYTPLIGFLHLPVPFCYNPRIHTITNYRINVSTMEACSLSTRTGIFDTVLLGCKSNNKYQIKNSLGQKVFFAVEENDCCTRNWCGPLRPFTIKVLDNYGQEVLTLSRPLKCGSCCCPCCLQELEVQAPLGNPIGYISQDWHPLKPKFTIQNERKEPVLKLEGPGPDCICCSDIIFEVKSVDDTHVVGKVCKQWSGFLRETFTDADNFGIQFPMDLDVKIKAVMIGACFLIDFMYFEEK